MKVVDFAGIKVDNISLEEAASQVEMFLKPRESRLIVTPNPELIVAAQDDKELKEIVNSASLRVPDGISMVVVSKMLKKPLKERVTGIDLMLKIVKKCGNNGHKVFLLGGEPGVAEEAAKNLCVEYPGLNVVGTHHGYFKEQEKGKVIQKIKVSKPDMLFVGLGGGQQEKWVNRHLKDLGVPVSMTIGGSLDVISGKKKRAPKWVRALYIEWLYRLITEPDRWKRQLALPKFLYLTLVKKVI